ncbi:hypothetical protein CTI12_AA238730 [Artemisia annua]|uniref:Uncharacterized protein n=1 Tax=Artemisia annua TaxID=35608 RepID=A0A2U1NRL4_ARTAN|nr:hypothetical protein CTI12_AA238730 [Artemisia annua]
MTLLVTHQLQGSCTPSRPSCLWESPLIDGSKLRFIKISSFKGNVERDRYKDGLRWSHSGNKYDRHSYLYRDSKETLLGSPNAQNIHAHSAPDEDVTEVGSLAIRKLFRSWLTFLPSASLSEDETLTGSTLNERVELDDKILKDGFFKRIWFKFWGMDAMIKIPAIIFIPLFMIVNMKYGAQVSKELYPLWISGPLLVALYIKMVQALCSLYVFSFKQSVKMVKKFNNENDKESIRVHLWQRVVYFRNLDYKKEAKRIWKDFQEWLGDKCLDLVESMWSYRGMVGFIKFVKIV